MRAVSLMGLAAEAEALRLRRLAAGSARRAAWGAVAAAFGVAALVLFHVATVALLSQHYGLAAACAMVGVADIFAACLLALLARRRFDPVAAEALALRQRSLASILPTACGKMTLADAQSAAPVLGALAGEAVAAWLRRR